MNSESISPNGSVSVNINQKVSMSHEGDESSTMLEPTIYSSDIVSNLIKLVHSGSIADQQEAAIGLNVFISESFSHNSNDGRIGPICHALSRLLDTRDRLCVLYSARAIKTISISDSGRSDLIRAGLLKVCLRTLSVFFNGDDVVIREILAALLNLCYDERGTSELLVSYPNGILDIGKIISSSDNSCREFALQTIANILYHASSDNDSIQKCILSPAQIEHISNIIPAIVSIAYHSKIPTESEYAAAVLANAALDSRLIVALRKSRIVDSNQMTTFKRERLPTYNESRSASSPHDLVLFRVGHKKDQLPSKSQSNQQKNQQLQQQIQQQQQPQQRYRYLWYVYSLYLML